MSSLLISIIVPCYNQADYLDECLQSVFHQQYQNWECIFINDGSTDDTEELALKWIQKDSRFQYFKQENSGVATARNFGIEKAKGKWILPLDGDDKISKNLLQIAAEKIEEGYDFVYSRAEYFGNKSGEIPLFEFSFERLLHYNILCSTSLFNKEKANNICFDPNLKHGLEDWDFWISYFSQNSHKVFKIDEVLFQYRIKEISRNQIVNNEMDKMQESKDYIFKKHEKTYLKYLGSYYDLLTEIKLMKQENAKLSKITNSRKYKFIAKIAQLFGR